MLLHEQQQLASVHHHGSVPGSSGGGKLDQLRQTGESLFNAGDEAINRALEGDSLAFLEATTQRGGQ